MKKRLISDSDGVTKGIGEWASHYGIYTATLSRLLREFDGDLNEAVRQAHLRRRAKKQVGEEENYEPRKQPGMRQSQYISMLSSFYTKRMNDYIDNTINRRS